MGSGQAKLDPNENALTALAMASADLVHWLNSVYSKELHDFLSDLVPEGTIDDNKMHLSYSRLVTSALARIVMEIVWKNSKFVSAEALKLAGFQRPLEHQELTKHSICKLVVEGMGDVGFDKINAIQISIHRIATALEYFGLIEYKEIRTNYRALEGTENLHKLMRHVNIRLASGIQAQIFSNAPKL